MTVKVLADKRRGRPLLLGYEVDKQVQAYLKSLREMGLSLILLYQWLVQKVS